MRNILTLLFLQCAFVCGSLQAQIGIEQKIITFDRLSKTIIPFVANAQPSIQVTSKAITEFNRTPPPYTLEYANGKGTIIISQQVPEGEYTFTLTSGKTSAQCLLKVLPAMLDDMSMKMANDSKFFYGYPIRLWSRLHPEAALPIQQFVIDYRLGNQTPQQGKPYSENWNGPCIPASAKVVRLAVLWLYPPTGERVPLFEKEYYPEQTPPSLEKSQAKVELVSDTVKKIITYQATSSSPEQSINLTSLRNEGILLVLKGIRINYDVPMDADNSNPAMSKPRNATLGDIDPYYGTTFGEENPDEIIYEDTPMIDYEHSELKIYNGNELDQTAAWKLLPSTLGLVHDGIDYNNSALQIYFLARLPNTMFGETRVLKGTLVAKVGARIDNRKAGVSGKRVESISIPISLTYTFPKSQYRDSLIKQNDIQAVQKLSKQTILEPLCASCSGSALNYPLWRVTSSVLREEVQSLLIKAGRKLPFEPLGAEVPLIVGGFAKYNRKYELYALRFGEELLTRRELDETMLQALNDILSAPISKKGGKNYFYDTLSAQEQVQEYRLIQSRAVQSGKYEGKSVLRSLNNYLHAGYAIFEADSLVVERLSEVFTPGLPRTKGLEQAEKECTETANIKERIRLGKPVPRSLIDEGVSPQDCEVVKNYYIAQAGLVRIGRAYIVADMRSTEPRIIGIVSTQSPNALWKGDSNTFIIESLKYPFNTGTLDHKEMQEFKTVEYEKDEETGKMIPAKGSILNTPHNNLFDYCLAALRSGTFIDRTASVMTYPAQRNK